VVIIMVTILAMADTRRSGEYVFAHYDASASGWPVGWAFFVGLLQAAYTLTGYGMVSMRSKVIPGSGLGRLTTTGGFHV
jgi:ABC-type Fe3+ transport system substrate-binding protein